MAPNTNFSIKIGTGALYKLSLGAVLKKHEKTIRKSIVFYGPKPSSSIEKQTLLLILGHSEKQWKNYPKRVPKSRSKSFENDHWAVKVRFIHRCYRFGPLSKKHVFSICPKRPIIITNRPKYAQGQILSF